MHNKVRGNLNTAFIINPRAGIKGMKEISADIYKHIHDDLNYEIIVWEYSDQDIEKNVQSAIDNEVMTLCVLGGDGSVNRVASSLVGKDLPLLVIPTGSGNGLARHLKVPLEISKSVKLLKEGNRIAIDVGTINGKYFFTTCGIGFDAEVGKLTADENKKGLFTYILTVFKQFFKYKSRRYHLELDGVKIHTKAFLITFGNANQYGNNAFIAPYADIQDGKLEVTIIKPFPIFFAPLIAFRLFNGKLHKSKYCKIYSAKKIFVKQIENMHIHTDGEPYNYKGDLDIGILPNALNIIVPKEWGDNN